MKKTFFKLIKINSLLSLSLIAVFIASIFISVISSNKGSKIADIEAKIAKLEQENREIETVLISKSSLREANQTAVEIGLAPSQKIIYLNKEVTVATLR